jgi:anti-anti-sigma factor
MGSLYLGLTGAPRGYFSRSMEDELSIRTSRDGNTATVAATGEIDLSTVDELRSAVTGAAEGVDQLRLDLTDVEFIDSAGLGGLLELRSTLRGRAVTLVIDAGEGPVRQAMEITGLSELLAR